MKTIPSRLVVLGGGPAGVEIAEVVQRLGGQAVLIDGADRLIPREPAPLGVALTEALRRDGIELHLGVQAAGASHDGGDYVVSSRTGPRYEQSDCSSRPAAVRASKGSGSRQSVSSQTHAASSWTSICVPPTTFGPLEMSTGSGP